MSQAAIDVAAAVIVAGDKVLAARRREGLHLAGFWEFPGGKIEPGETPRQCLVRELFEELGVWCRIGPYLGQSLFDYGEKQVRLLAYLAHVVDGELSPVDHDQLRWVASPELSLLRWAPADVPLLAMVADYLLGDFPLS